MKINRTNKNEKWERCTKSSQINCEDVLKGEKQKKKNRKKKEKKKKEF